MLSLFSKVVATGATLSGIFFINFNSSNNIVTEKGTKNATQIEDITSIEDIKLFEKLNNCTFAFVGSWDNKEVYKLEEFLRIYNQNDWKSRVINGSKKFKTNCKSNKQVALFWGNNNNTFNLDENRFKNN